MNPSAAFTRLSSERGFFSAISNPPLLSTVVPTNTSGTSVGVTETLSQRHSHNVWQCRDRVHRLYRFSLLLLHTLLLVAGK